MDLQKISVSMILIGLGLVFFFNNENIGKGAAKFYQKLYTEKNLKVMFKILGGLLVLGGLAVMFAK